MITKFLRISFLIILSLSVFACSSDDDDTGPAEAPVVKFRAQINNNAFRTDNAEGFLSNDGRFLTITGTNEENQTLTLRIGSLEEDASEITDATYVIDEDNLASMTYTSGDMIFTSDIEAGGAITITSIDQAQNTIFGSFSGTLSSPEGGELTVQSGALFNVSYTEQ